MIHRNSGRHHQCPKHTRSVAFCVCVKESLRPQRVCYTLWERAMVLSSTLTLTALPQIKNPFNYKTASCPMLLLPSGISGSCTLFSVVSHLLSFQTSSLRCESCSPVIPHSGTISEAAQLSSTLRTANLIVLHTLMIKAENEIPCCLTALRTVTGFCTWK